MFSETKIFKNRKWSKLSSLHFALWTKNTSNSLIEGMIGRAQKSFRHYGKVKQIEIYKFANKKQKRVTYFFVDERLSIYKHKKSRVCAKIMNLSIKMKNHNAHGMTSSPRGHYAHIFPIALNLFWWIYHPHIVVMHEFYIRDVFRHAIKSKCPIPCQLVRINIAFEVA